MKIAVYCGSGMGNSPAFAQAAENLGRWIGENGHCLIYGGGDSGLMGITAKNAHATGREVIGVVPGDVEFISSRPQPFVTELVVARNMSERKQTMLERADAFVALPGGIGTVDEISEAITLTKIGVFNKKCILINTDGFYEPFRNMLLEMEKAQFLTADEMKHVLFSDDLKEIEEFLERG